MKIKTIIITLGVFYFHNILFSQNLIILRGSVIDSLQKPLPFVNIYSQEAENAPIIAFTATDDKGNFVLKTTRPKALIVKATLLGYEAKSLIFNEKDTISEYLNFVMRPKDFVLKEAVVKANGRIIEKTDTTTFLADKFRDSTERNLEELLAKIPGVDIDKNSGVISVKGQPIKKILIEGDDLTGRNYQMLSKNLTADVVDKIQIIDKFNENKLLRGIRRSDDKVINITLKENRKNLLFGNAIVGLGNDFRTNNAINLFSFTKKYKSLTFGNYNTIGNKNDADRMLLSGFGNESEATLQRALIKDNNNTFINIGRTPSLDIGSQSLRFNNAAMLSTHFIVRPTERLQLKGFASLAKDRLQVFTDNEYQYRLPNATFNLIEKNKWIHRPEIGQAHFEAGFDLSENATFQYQTDIQFSRVNDASITNANSNLINNQLTNNDVSWNNRLDVTYRKSENKAILINALYIKNKAHQNYELGQTQSRKLPPSISDSFWHLRQSITKLMHYATLNGQFLFSKNQQKIAISLGVVEKTQGLNTNLTLTDSMKTSLKTPTDYQNEANFKQTNYYTSLNIKDQFWGINFFSDISGGYFNLRYDEILLENKLKHGIYALPIIGFQKETKKNKLFGTYAYNIALPQIADIYRGYIVSDYRSIERGSELFIPANSHAAILSASFGNFSDDFMCYTNLIGTATQNGYRNDWDINTDFNTFEKVENRFLNRNIVLSSGIEYYSSKLSARFKIRPTISTSWYQNTLNDNILRNTQTIISIIDLSVRSGYLGWFNYHFGTTLTHSNIKTDILATTVSKVQNLSMGAFLDVHLRFSKRLTGKLENEVFQFRQAQSPPQYYGFINSNLSYEISRSRIYMTLTGRNLLNSPSFINAYTSDLSTQINSVKLLPRYVLLEVNFRF